MSNAAPFSRAVVITAIGPDRPGIVNVVSRRVHEAGANLEDAKMAILGGEFALLMLVTGPDASLERLRQESQTIGNELGLRVLVTDTTRPTSLPNFLPYRLKVTGVDHPGIVHRVSEILAQRKINVASLESRLSYAPLSGTPMFILEAELQVPTEVTVKALRTELADTCEQENLDFTLESKG